MQLRVVVVLGLVSMSLLGCSRLAMDNSSLDYKSAKTVPPLKVPESLQMRPQHALYPAPEVDPRALEQAPNFSNKKGNRFDLPRPEPVAEATATSTGTAPSRPQLVQDGNGIPLLKVDGGANQVWEYVTAAVSASNFETEAGETPNVTQIRYQDQNYQLRLTPSGASNTLGVYNTDNNFADRDVASEILALIFQNWPA
ncbi:lipoprotein-34 precursor (NlpB) [Acinetobacter sp. A3.8]|uniref:Lipoprotein-34 (NlpB) n=2 Tax=Acinetobacter sedimenti TaxID=2919922 RepID=A0A9X1WV64_9GAMM|nr:lipoprotein-34 precursor (NlpB) [Acinetobacter sedimenti]MCJ8145621.1 lipoprotein-34 precursor (NlpB) [Acinetobacter sedimenti]